jgi:hypothetical protein
MGVVVALGVVVAHGNSGGSLVVTLDCKPAVPSSNLAISLAFSRLQGLRENAPGMAFHCRLYSTLRKGRGKFKQEAFFGPPKTINGEKNCLLPYHVLEYKHSGRLITECV